MNDFNANSFKQLERSDGAIRLCVVYFFDVTQVNEPLSTGRAREVSYEGEFFDHAWAVTVDHGIFFRMETATVTRFVPIATIRQPGGIAIVANGQNFSEISARDDGSDI